MNAVVLAVVVMLGLALARVHVVIALILGVAAAAGVLYAAWQTLRADDELWVADDPLRAPDA